MVKAVVGANWGDEGKGKITDTLADQADVVPPEHYEHHRKWRCFRYYKVHEGA